MFSHVVENFFGREWDYFRAIAVVLSLFKGIEQFLGGGGGDGRERYFQDE